MGFLGMFRNVKLVHTGRLAELEIKESALVEAVQELDMVGYSLMGYADGQPAELRADNRIKWKRKAQVAWMNDPMAAAAIDLMNDFVFGRGVPRPRAKDPDVQKVIDDFWDDPDNQRVLTTYEAQVALGTDLSLQSNVFVLMFDQGDDGKVKLGLLNHDEVLNAVPDPNFRQRVLYYLARHRRMEWDFVNDQPKMDLSTVNTPATYYESWQLHSEPDDFESVSGEDAPKPPAKKLGVGCVYHVRMNRTSEMIFGVPTMQRTLRWFNAYNEFMGSRVDVAKAVAAFIMKRKVKGTPTQLSRIAAKAISRASDLAGATGTSEVSTTASGYPQLGPRPGSILNENDSVSHEAFRIPSGSGDAETDGQMIRAQISAATRFPQHYLGDVGSANLANATAMELPVLKAVEARQELFEQLIRWAVDRAIERAVDVGNLDPAVAGGLLKIDREVETPGLADEARDVTKVTEAFEDVAGAESDTQRDLGYEFSMPSPLRRMMVDLVAAATQTLQVLDPNNTNTELSRVMLTMILGEGFEMQDPANVVERIFPDGYVDPAVAAAQAAAGLGPDGQPLPDQAASGGGGQTFGQLGGGQSAGAKALGGDTTYGAKGGAVPAGGSGMRESFVLRNRSGDPVYAWPLREGHRLDDGDELVRAAAVGRGRSLDDDFATMEGQIADELATLLVANGHGERPEFRDEFVAGDGDS